MATSIQVDVELLNELKKRKLNPRETYEEVIWDLIEDAKELDEQTLADVEQARREIREGNYYTFAQVKKELAKKR